MFRRPFIVISVKLTLTDHFNRNPCSFMQLISEPFMRCTDTDTHTGQNRDHGVDVAGILFTHNNLRTKRAKDICTQKCLVDERGQKRTVRLVRVDSK